MGMGRHVFFAGGGTGGHLYPAMAVAAQIRQRNPETEILFFCSGREIDAKILAPSEFDFLPLPAVGFSLSPRRCIRFFAQFIKSYYFAKQILHPHRQQAAVLGTGGFVSAPVILAARSLRIPVFVLNVDSVPGKANKFLARYAKKIFVQFEQTKEYFAKCRAEIIVTGCPLRREFYEPAATDIPQQYSLDADKKILLITGASSGSLSINRAILEILSDLRPFADSWQIVHLTGIAHFDQVQQAAGDSAIHYLPLEYSHDMPALLKIADLVVGRAGAVSVAEYAAAGVPAICLPYPYHKDRHQFLNAQPLVEAGAAVIVEDSVENPQQTAEGLLRILCEFMENPARLESMTRAAKQLARPNAAATIADSVLNA